MALGHLVDATRIKPHQSKVVAIQGFLIFATLTILGIDRLVVLYERVMQI